MPGAEVRKGIDPEVFGRGGDVVGSPYTPAAGKGGGENRTGGPARKIQRRGTRPACRAARADRPRPTLQRHFKSSVDAIGAAFQAYWRPAAPSVRSSPSLWRSQPHPARTRCARRGRLGPQSSIRWNALTSRLDPRSDDALSRSAHARPIPWGIFMSGLPPGGSPGSRHGPPGHERSQRPSAAATGRIRSTK